MAVSEFAYGAPSQRNMSKAVDTFLNGNGGNGPSNGTVSAWARAIAVVGIPGVIALFLVYVSATEIPRLALKVEETKQLGELNRDLLKQIVAQQDEMTRLSRWICVGVSKNENDRRQCFDK